MEFRAQQDHHHHHNNNNNSDQIRATSATSFNRQQQSPAGGSRRSLLSNTTHNIGNTNNNNNASTLTSTDPNSCTTATTQTLETTPTYQQVRPLQQVQLQPQPNNNQTTHRDLEPTTASKPSKPTPASSSSAVAAAAAVATKYRECLKNHAASVGGSVYDGCGEFMPSGDEGSLEALRCAACSCHRNFHRKEPDGGGSAAENQLALYSPGTRRSSTANTPLPLLPSPTGLHHMSLSPHPHHHHHHPGHHYGHHPHQRFPIVQPMNVAYGGGGGGNESSSEELNATADNSGPPGSHHHHHQHHHQAQPPYGSSKKRFRTKFTQDQKERMLEFAERVGWRFQKQDEDEVERFCSEVGVKRQVLKVWMHNNKSNNVKTTNQLQVDHVSILMGNMGNSTSAGTTTTTTTATTATDVLMNQHISDEAVEDEEDEEGLD